MQAFEALEDPRRRASCAYPLDELLLTALCAVTSGADDWVADGAEPHRSMTAVGAKLFVVD
ncbi:MAG: transposase family protein [Roseateles sp.]|uniref:transposase family protein n=1 Tax=Roseateles sp. TaxID=1971397 RepID=UPI0039E8E080